MNNTFFRLNFPREVGNECEFSVGAKDVVSLRVLSICNAKGTFAFLLAVETYL